MEKNVSRRSALKLALAGAVASGLGCSAPNQLTNVKARKASTPMNDKWEKTHDRVWIGGEYWANPMEDWRVNNGGIECSNRGGNRSVHSLTHQLTDASGEFSVSAVIQRTKTKSNDGGASIRLGIRSELNEFRSNCFVQKGLDAGIVKNELVLGSKRLQLKTTVGAKAVRLDLSGKAQYGAVSLNLKATLSETGELLGEINHLVASNDVLGNIALVSNFAIPAVHWGEVKDSQLGSLYRFANWTIEGTAFSEIPEQKFGPLLWAMYSLSDLGTDEGFVMKISAYTGPMSEKDNQYVELYVKEGLRWVGLGKEKLDSDGWVATFRIANWDESKDKEYKLVYREQHSDGTETLDAYQGVIKANPKGRPLRMAALTCQNDYGFPYEPVANNVVGLNPDLVFFSGDQIYESHGGFGIIREPADAAILNYLRKFYQFGWAFRDAMRNQPTVCLPDDHDVFQGNLWGEEGAKMKNPEKDPSASVLGGYIEPVRMINAVHKTTLNHHPDPHDPTPTNGIGSYYGQMVYGDVGFAILADRQWKSGPERVNVQVGKTGMREDPQFINPAFNPPGLELLGKRQEEFLANWAEDWRGHKLKAVLSQTVFAGISTHQPKPDRYLKYDFDSSGFPASARDRAIEIMRPSMALHICGDTHLGTLSQYGVKEQRDSNWAFCTPAISAGWPRWWLPDDVGLPMANRPSHGLPQTGEYLDSFGNKIYVYAVGNPEVGRSGNRYVKAHEKGSGFGVITFDTKKLTYTMDAYRFLVDATAKDEDNQYPGWPVTIHQEENKGVNRLG